mmetsp:Transcript_64533/g.154148  ORF Transcript_64533/g.154148 Transcript_64533/m.154148 type:complete len:200 (-) Transcript_64533:774-1373(-)
MPALRRCWRTARCPAPWCATVKPPTSCSVSASCARLLASSSDATSPRAAAKCASENFSSCFRLSFTFTSRTPTAICKGVWPLASAARKTPSIPTASRMRNSKASTQPRLAAACAGVLPSLAFTLRGRRCLCRNLSTSMWPAPWWATVKPHESCEESASLLVHCFRRFKATTQPRRAAMCTGRLPSSALASIGTSAAWRR